MLGKSVLLFLAAATAVRGNSVQVSDYEDEAIVDRDTIVKDAPSTNPTCKKDQHVIENQHDLHQLSNACSTVDGSISFQNYMEPHIDLGGIKVINGNFIVEENNEVVSIHGDALQKIGGTFKLYDLTSLNAVNFPRLQDLNTVHWRIVPILSSVVLDSNIRNVKSLVISDSSLTTLGGFDNIISLETLNINNNRYLESIVTDLKYISKQLSVSANADDLKIDMSELIWANNVTIRDTKEINLDNLQYVNHSMEFIENKVNSLNLGELKTVGGTLGIIENKQLSKVDFNNVTQISGGLMIANNDALEKINFFKSLRLIGGAILFKGNIKDTDFPSLRLVKGSAIIESTSDELDCSKWVTPDAGSSIIRGGKIECNAKGKKSTASTKQDGTVLDRTTNEPNDKEETNGSTTMSTNLIVLVLTVLVTVRAIA